MLNTDVKYENNNLATTVTALDDTDMNIFECQYLRKRHATYVLSNNLLRI